MVLRCEAYRTSRTITTTPSTATNIITEFSSITLSQVLKRCSQRKISGETYRLKAGTKSFTRLPLPNERHVSKANLGHEGKLERRRLMQSRWDFPSVIERKRRSHARKNTAW